jgi:hypothetical protein
MKMLLSGLSVLAGRSIDNYKYSSGHFCLQSCCHVTTIEVASTLWQVTIILCLLIYTFHGWYFSTLKLQKLTAILNTGPKEVCESLHSRLL